MNQIFNIVGENFFSPLSSPLKSIYLNCIKIIYNTYRTELSYGADRDIMVNKLMEYFDSIDVSDIVFEDDEEKVSDSRNKASVFLRKLREYGWIENDIGNDKKVKIIMPNHAIAVIQTITSIERQEELEYQSELSAIYAVLTNEELRQRPYLQVIKPVYDHTLTLFTELKKLNTSIRKYIDELTADMDSEEIVKHFFTYNDEIGSKAYHRIKTSDNISKFRNVIVGRLQNYIADEEMMKLVVEGYKNIENENNQEAGYEKVLDIIHDTIGYFRSYDEILQEIDQKHSKYIRNAVERAKFLLLNSNNVESKLSKILQMMAFECNKDEVDNGISDASDEICQFFNIFPQGFISGESLRTIPITRKMTELEELNQVFSLTEDERELRKMAVYEKNKNRFTKKNVNAFVMQCLENKNKMNASELEVTSRRDMIRIIFISLYGRSIGSPYMIIRKENKIIKEGFEFNDFEIVRRHK